MFPHRGLLLYGLATSLLTFLIGGYSSSLILLTVWLRIYTSFQSRAFILVTSAAIPISLILWHRSNSQQHPIKPQDPPPIVDPGPLIPLILPCRTTHTRLFPKKHSLSYSYLQVGIPIGWRGSNSILGIDDSRQTPWLNIRAADHLARDQTESSLDGKLSVYLSSQGENLKDYAHVYLVTAPRFLGYVFNPVSFWYLFSTNMSLEAMILEVNNTFDERRMYFMKRDTSTDIDTTSEELKFTHTWPKDFHVSPFNSRKGTYTLTATNPFKHPNPKINNTITLTSSENYPKLVARIFSIDQATNPTNMNNLDTIRFLSTWFWTGFLTFPRILKEAAILFFKHQLPIWYRPEVAKTSIARQPTKRERTIESAFQSFLRDQIHLSPTPISLTYIPPTGSTADTLYFTSAAIQTGSSPCTNLTLQILTPGFYADIAITSIPVDYISASVKQPLERQTFTTTSHQDLAGLFNTTIPPAKDSSTRLTTSIRAYILSTIRQRGKRAPPHVLDEWVLHCPTLTSEQKTTYFKSATALVIANRGLAGFDIVLDWMIQGMQIGLIWIVTGYILDLRNT